jgi:hypothetical protein
MLTRLASDNQDVALVAAELHLEGAEGVELLERAHVLHPHAMRALLLSIDQRGTRITFGALPAVQRATALGRIDLLGVELNRDREPVQLARTAGSSASPAKITLLQPSLTAGFSSTRMARPRG